MNTIHTQKKIFDLILRISGLACQEHIEYKELAVFTVSTFTMRFRKHAAVGKVQESWDQNVTDRYAVAARKYISNPA